MGITGKYDFKGIQKAGRLGIRALLSSTTWGASLLASPFNKPLNVVIDWLVNYLANRGLVILNLGAIYVNGELDQKAFDKALDDGLKKVNNSPNLSQEQRDAIDEEVRNAARRFFKFRTAK